MPAAGAVPIWKLLIINEFTYILVTGMDSAGRFRTGIDMNRRREQGFALIDLVFVCGIIGVLASIAMPRMLLARQQAGAASAIGSLRTINSAQLTFAITCGSGFYAPGLLPWGTAPVGSNVAFISPTLTGGAAVTRGGYIIQVSATPFAGAPASCNGVGVGGTGQGFKAAADPIEPTNSRFFGTNANLQMFEHVSSLWATIPRVASRDRPPAAVAAASKL